MEEFLQIFKAIDLKYTLSTCLLTYLIIEAIRAVLPKKLPHSTKKTWIKRAITIISGTILAIIYTKLNLLQLDVIIPSFLLSIVLYDYLIKIIIQKVKNQRSNETVIKKGNTR